MTTHVNSKVLGVLDPHQVSEVMKGSRTSTGGYPIPGSQSPNVTSVMNKDCFVDENTWRLIAENGEFDDIVVGSGFCGLAYIDEALRLNPFRRILLLERGGFWLPDHFQNLPLPFQFVQHEVSETFPWELASESAKKQIYLSGSSPFFGGRSAFWSIWSPLAIGANAPIDADAADQVTPDRFDLMDDFPRFMKEIAKKPDFYKGVDRLLNVQRADQITDPVFRSVLQTRFDDYLLANRPAIIGAQFTEPARLATGVPIGRPTTGFRQFSTIGSLLSINERQNELVRQNPPAGKPIMIATDVVVKSFEVEGPADKPTHARVLHTSRGPLTLRRGKTNVILATGAIPATTILLNSLDQTVKNRGTPQNPIDNPTGKRLTSHFRSQIKARFKPDEPWAGQPLVGDNQDLLTEHPVISSCHVRGRDVTNGNLQWHIQVNGAYVPKDYQGRGLSPEEKAQRSSMLFTSLAPDNGDTLTPEQLKTSEGYVIVSCSVLGEHPPTLNSKVELNKSDPDVTTNIRLHLELPDSVTSTSTDSPGLWETMERSTFQAIRVIANDRAPELEYWNREDRRWELVNDDTERRAVVPSKPHLNRVKFLFHEASTTFMDENITAGPGALASVNKSYRPLGLETGNVYVTGAGLLPTAGSWNPTPTIVGFAQHLAKTLVIPPRRVGVFTQEQLVPTTKTLGRPYIIGFKGNGTVSFWSFSGQKLTPPTNCPGTHDYTNKKHVRLLADTTGNGFYDLVLFGDTGVHIATRKSEDIKFNNFVTVPVLEGFTYNAGWRVDKHIRYMVDVSGKAGRADIVGFGDAGVFLSKNESTNDNSRFTPPSIVLYDLCYDKGWRLNKHLRFLADFYGKGLPDIIGFGETSVVVAKNNGNGTFEEPCDVVKKGLVDEVLTEFSYSKGWRVNRDVRTLADTTGNGLADIVGFGEAGVYIATNEGKTTVKLANSGEPVLRNFGYKQNWRVDKHPRFVVDVNGDGRGDIVGFGNKGVYLSTNRGDGTFEEARLAIRDFGYDQGWRIEKHLRFMVDVTGNGCADIIGFKDDMAYVSFNDGQGNFGHALSLDSDPDSTWRKDWDPSTTAAYVTCLDKKYIP